MASLSIVLTALTAALFALLVVSVACSAVFFRRLPATDAPLTPMTMIRPLKGREPGLDENLRSPIDADQERVLQTLFAIETREDPAFPVCEAIVRDYPDRDLEIVLTGPSGPRMGKAHNMIEAIKRAKYPLVVFSDSDVRAARPALLATSAAFAAGAEVASALPDGSAATGMTDALLAACFNHYFAVPAVLLYRTGRITPMAGGWLACRKSFLDRIGGLESMADRAAEDISIALEAKRLGARAVLLPVLTPIREHGGTPLQLLRHMLKWAKIIRFSTPAAFAALPALDFCFVALLAWLLGGSWLAPASAVAGRIVLAIAQDGLAARRFFPFWLYLALPILDLVCIAVWIAAFLSNTIEWRGKTYRLLRGGRLEVLSG